MTAFPLPHDFGSYLASAFVICLCIRFVLSLLRWSEKIGTANPISFWSTFWGFKAGEDINDYFQPFLVGLLEILVYPVLLAAGKPEYIGAWLGLKVLPKLGVWSTHRENYQRFLIGNALVIISSYFLRRWFYA